MTTNLPTPRSWVVDKIRRVADAGIFVFFVTAILCVGWMVGQSFLLLLWLAVPLTKTTPEEKDGEDTRKEQQWS